MPTQCTLHQYRSKFLAVTLENKKQYLLKDTNFRRTPISFTISVPVVRFQTCKNSHAKPAVTGEADSLSRKRHDLKTTNNNSLFQRLIPHRTQKGFLRQQRQYYRCKAGFESLKCREGVVRFSFSGPANALFRREHPTPLPPAPRRALVGERGASESPFREPLREGDWSFNFCRSPDSHPACHRRHRSGPRRPRQNCRRH
jgi:hypothetical protein